MQCVTLHVLYVTSVTMLGEETVQDNIALNVRCTLS